MKDKKITRINVWNNPESSSTPSKPRKRMSKADRLKALLPAKLGKAIRLPVPDFSDPDRPLTCLEADFFPSPRSMRYRTWKAMRGNRFTKCPNGGLAAVPETKGGQGDKRGTGE